MLTGLTERTAAMQAGVSRAVATLTGCLVLLAALSATANASYEPKSVFPEWLTSPVVAPDGKLWGAPRPHTVAEKNWRLVELASNGSTREFLLPRVIYPKSHVTDIALGPDGAIWCIAPGPTATRAAIIRVDRSGNRRRFELRGKMVGRPYADKVWLSLAAGSDGNIWFTGLRNSVGRLSGRR